jgi:hypothetical protein
MTGAEAILAEARTDRDDRLVAAGEPLAGLQLRCGGELPGTIAVPALLALVRKARRHGLPLARAIAANDGQEAVTAWVEVRPDADYGTHIVLRSWQVGPLPAEDVVEARERREAIERAVAELTARLDAAQNVLSVEADAPDLAEIGAALRARVGRPWTDSISVAGSAHRQPLHWRLLDGAAVDVPGSARSWRVALHPVEVPGREPVGYELCLLAETPPAPAPAVSAAPVAASEGGMLGRDVAPVLREPIARIVANAAAIRTRSAGPLSGEYARYAGDIEAAGEHLLALIEDLADLETVEDDGFTAARDHIDLADAARSAAQILAARATERTIGLDPPREGESLPAVGEFRRVLQVLLNLIGNAVRYSPEGSQVWIRAESDGRRARVIVADQGAGLELDQQARVFDKFERLGRSDEGGTGLGLYISRRLARAMGGDLTVESAPGQGARFVLELPAE